MHDLIHIWKWITTPLKPHKRHNTMVLRGLVTSHFSETPQTSQHNGIEGLLLLIPHYAEAR